MANKVLGCLAMISGGLVGPNSGVERIPCVVVGPGFRLLAVSWWLRSPRVQHGPALNSDSPKDPCFRTCFVRVRVGRLYSLSTCQPVAVGAALCNPASQWFSKDEQQTA